MAYRKIDVDTKLNAVTRVLRGERAAAVARGMGLDRNSLSLWLKRAAGAIRRDLGEGAAHGGRGASRAIQKLRGRDARQRRLIRKLSESLRRMKEGPMPVRCERCGCARFYRNGFVLMDLENILGGRLNGANRKVPVQKYSCVNCGGGVHLRGHLALYHWVAGSRGEGRRRPRPRNVTIRFADAGRLPQETMGRQNGISAFHA